MTCHILHAVGSRGKAAQRGFTLIELLVVLTIILVLSSVGVFLYGRAIAHAKDTVCKTNLKALNEAVILYLQDNDAFPASLGHLEREHLEKAYAKVMNERGWHKKCCFWLLRLDSSEHAYAQFLTYDNLKKYGANQQAFQCPANPDGAVSYGINAAVAGKSFSEISANTVLIADCDSHAFTSPDQIRKRHAAGKGFAIQKNGQIVEVKQSNASSLLDPDDAQPTLSPDPDVNDPAPAVRPTPGDKVPANLTDTVKYFDDLVNDNLNTPIAAKAEDVRDKLQSALNEISKSPPDYEAAQGIIEGAEADLKAMIKDGLIAPSEGADLKKVLRGISKIQKLP